MSAWFGEHPYLRVEQRHVDPLPDTGRAAVGECRLNRDHGIQAREEVRERDPRFLRLPRRIARQVHDAAHPLDHEVVPRTAGVRAVLAEPGDRAVDEPRIEAMQAVVVEAELPQTADLEVLDEHVGAGRELPDDGLAFGPAQIDGDRALASIGGMEIRGVASAVGVVDRGRTPLARVVAAEALDFHDRRAEVREHLTGPGTGQDARELDHLQAAERRRCRLRHGLGAVIEWPTLQGRTVTLLITGGVTGLLMAPSSPAVVRVSAMASTVVIPDVTLAKMT